MRIRLPLFSIFLVFMTMLAAKAQFSVGLVGFPQITNLTSKTIRQDPVMDNKLTFGGGGGITLTYGFSETLGIQLGGLYSSQNQKIRSTYTIGGQEYTHDSKKRFDYIKVPLLLRIVQPLGNANFIVFAGPQFSYLLKYDGGMIVYIEDEYFDLPETPGGNDYYKKYTIDAAAGIGYELPLSQTLDFVSALKVDYSITNAQNSNVTYNDFKVSDIGGGDKSRNMTYALMLGLNFKFKDPNALISPTNKFRRSSSHKKKRY
jgi:hypothetical protein